MKSFVAASAVMVLAATVASAKPIVESPANLIQCQVSSRTQSRERAVVRMPRAPSRLSMSARNHSR